LGVCPRTVTKWCDNGTLPSWRLAGGNDRRIGASALYHFMVEGGYPLHDFPHESLQWVEREMLSVLFVGDENERVREIIVAAGGVIAFAHSLFDAGLQMKARKPDVVLLDGGFPDPRKLIEGIGIIFATDPPPIVLFGPGDLDGCKGRFNYDTSPLELVLVARK